MADPSTPTGPTPVAAVRPMTAEEFRRWREGAIHTYAEDRSRAAGTALADELAQARTGSDATLPARLPNRVRADDQGVRRMTRRAHDRPPHAAGGGIAAPVWRELRRLARWRMGRES